LSSELSSKRPTLLARPRLELGDVIANGVGVSCGTLLGLPFRALIPSLTASNSLLCG